MAVASPALASAAEAPSIAGTVNAGSFRFGGGFDSAPGAVVSIFGRNLGAKLATASRVPLPDETEGTRALVNGTPAPLYFVSPTQINAQLPYGPAAGPVTLQVTTASGSRGTERLEFAEQAPALYRLSRDGRGRAM